MTQTDEEIYYVMDWKNQYCENGYTIQNNLQIQCNPYQTTNGILQRTRKKILFTICIKFRRSQITQTILRKEDGVRQINLPDSDYTTKFQSPRQYGPDILKTEI